MTSSNFCSIADLPHSLPIYRSSRSQMLFTIGVLKSFTIFSRKYLCWSLFIIKFIKKRLHHRCFLVHIATFLRTALFIEHLLLLCSVKKVFLEISQNSQANTKKRKKRLWHRCFPVNFAKFIIIPFLTEYLQWLLLFMPYTHF